MSLNIFLFNNLKSRMLADFYIRGRFKTVFFYQFSKINDNPMCTSLTFKISPNKISKYLNNFDFFYLKILFLLIFLGYQPWMERGMFNTPGTYELKIGPQNSSYDYSFTSSSLCCQPGKKLNLVFHNFQKISKKKIKEK